MGITSAYLLAGEPNNNGKRLGLLPEEVTQWKGFSDRVDALYAKYYDKKKGRTTAIKDELLVIIEETISFDKKYHFLDRISSSLNVNVTDLTTFNIKSGVMAKGMRTLHQTPIGELVKTDITPIGGGSVTIKCYNSTSKRAGILDTADCVQYLHMVGSTPPVSAENDSLKLGSSTKGIFTLATSPGCSGKNLYIYFRWFNSKHPEIAGPWSPLQTMLLL